MNDLYSLQDRMRALTDFIIDAHYQVRQGRNVNLMGLDAKVSQLCDDTFKLPPAQAMEMQPLIADMIGHLEDLSKSLEELKADLTQPKK